MAKIRKIQLFFLKMNKDCIFCKIVKGELPSYRIWEDENYLAFLGIFPNTKGMSVVIPKKHISGYVFKADDKIYQGLMKAAKEVGLLLDKKLEVERTAMIMEGTEVDHAHVKLYPLWGFKEGQKKEYPSYDPQFFQEYQGWLTSKEGPRISDAELEEVYRKIKE